MDATHAIDPIDTRRAMGSARCLRSLLLLAVLIGIGTAAGVGGF